MRSIPLWGKLLGGVGLLAGVVAAMSFVPTGDLAFEPVAPIDLTGKITVDGRPAEPLQGRLYLVGVAEREVNLLERLLLDVGDPSVDFAPVPDGRSGNGPARADVDAMASAKRVAAGVAFELAGEPVEWTGISVTVSSVDPALPAAKVLRTGDVIVRINGTDVDSAVDARRILTKLSPGSKVTLAVRRSGVARLVTLTTAPPAEGDIVNRSRIGAELATLGLKISLPQDVVIDSEDVVGPSAGLAFALYLYDSISSEDLLRGRYVVATGSLSPDGNVVAVGRIRQKVIAAHNAKRDMIIVPFANRAEARAAARAACGEEPDCLQVVPVHSVAEAVQLLELRPEELVEQLATVSD